MENSTTRVATLMVQHKTLNREIEAEEFDEPVVSTRHVNTRCGAEDKMSDLGLGLTHSLMAFTAASLPSLGVRDYIAN